MKIVFFRFAFLSLFVAAGCFNRAEAQGTNKLTAAAAAKWYAAGQWYRKTEPPKPKRTYDAFGREVDSSPADTSLSKVFNDPSPDAVVNPLEFAKQYQANPDRWDKAFWWLRHTDLAALPAGRYPIDGDDVYATITEGAPKMRDTTQWESHRNFEDIHYVIAGKEQLGIIPVAQARLLKPYEPDKDLASYSAKGKYYIGDPGRFYIVTTEEAHRPGIKTEGYDHLKKLCIKVRKS